MMPEAKCPLGGVVAELHDIATMRAALEAAWDQAGGRFAGAPPEVIAAARAAISSGIINGFKAGASDLLVLKHSGLTALRMLYPDRFSKAAE